MQESILILLLAQKSHKMNHWERCYSIILIVANLEAAFPFEALENTNAIIFLLCFTVYNTFPISHLIGSNNHSEGCA